MGNLDKNTLFDNTFELYSKDIFRYIYARVSNVESAEDLTSEVFIKFWKKLKSEDEIHNLRAFLYKIAHGIVIDEYRKHKNRTVSIEKIDQLKKIEADELIMNSIKNKVYSKIKQENTFFNWLAIPSFVLPAVFIFIGFIYFNPVTVANRSVEIANSKLNSTNNIQNIVDNEEYLDKAHKNVDRLNLNGQKWVYSKEQCQSSYLDYERYLLSFKQKVEQAIQKDNTNTNLIRIQEKITKYQFESEIKWPTTKN